MEVSEVLAVAAKRLPGGYEPLQLTFYHERSRASRDHVVVGDDYGTELQVRLSDGAVVSIDPDGELPTRFVNSSIERLASFIDAYRSYAGRVSADADAGPAARQLRERLAEIDPAAFDNYENWWAVVLEQAEHGLL